MTDLAFLSIAEVAAGYRNRSYSASEVTQAQLDRIAWLNPVYRPYVRVLEDRALAEAAAADAAFAANIDRGPLQGIPVGIKDLVDVAGVATTAGSTFFGKEPARSDATVVQRLRNAGAVILGKQHMHEFAADGPFNRMHGRTYNPWNKERYTGGSSSGSGVAVAGGLCFGAIGSDTAGSIRLPAAYCGTVGVKATYGAVPVKGSVQLSFTLDHLGPLTRTVEDGAIMLAALAGYDPTDPFSSRREISDPLLTLKHGVKGLRVGVPTNHFFDRLDPDTEAAVRVAVDQLADLGAIIVDVELPHTHECRAILFAILRAEVAQYHRPWFEANQDDYASQIKERIVQGRTDLAMDYVRARLRQAEITRAYEDVMADIDVVVTPTVPVPAFDPTLIEDPGKPHRVEWTGPFNVTGFPAVSVPCGFSREGLPIGLQVAAKPYHDAVALRVAYAFEQYNGWVNQHPAMPA